ncbi:MAG: PAS domain S-box protein [Patescibacteria group bacterium]|nr:PAS domain S-box protein [Patescibacteria group bacterium]
MSTTSMTGSPDSLRLEGLAEVLSSLGAESDHADARSRRQAAILAFGRRTIARPSLAVLMQDAVALIGEILGTGLAGITEVTGNGRSLVTTVASLDSTGHLKDPVSQQVPMNPVGSMAAFALTMANTVTTSDLPNEAAYQDMFLRKLGIRSAMCVPVHLNREPLGALSVFSQERRQFDTDDSGFAESISHLLAATIARVHAEEEMSRQTELAQSVLDAVDSLVITLDDRGHLLRMNGATERILGFTLAEVLGKAFTSRLLAPKAVEPFLTFFRNAMSEGESRGFEVELIAKDGSPRLVRFRGTRLMEQTRNRPTILLSGVDRTEVARLARELLKARDQLSKAEPVDLDGSALPTEGIGLPFQTTGELIEGHEMRSSPRRTYQYRQLIAPLIGDQLPPRNRFFEVVCEDISAGGIAFYLDTPPDFKRVVVGLGQSPQLTFFTATIARVAEKEVDGRRQFLVGCRFTGRIRR